MKRIAGAIAAVVLPISLQTLAQVPSAVVSTIGSTPIVKLNSADIPEILDLIHTKISSLGFAEGWEAGTAINQDVVVAEEIVVTRGKHIVITSKAINERNTLLFIAKRIRIIGPADSPLSIEWQSADTGPLRDPIPIPKAASGSPGVREGEDGKEGADGIAGNKGFRGQDAPSLIFVANRFDVSGPISFFLKGQDGGPGGAGQEGGDGGPGRPGRPGIPNIGGIGILNPSNACQAPIKGGKGGNGGRGGDGGLGGRAGNGGTVLIVGMAVTTESIKRFVSPESTLSAGIDGKRGKGGYGGRGGSGTPEIRGLGSCPPSVHGDGGSQGSQGNPRDDAANDSSPPRSNGLDGTFAFTILTSSQATSLGLR